MKFLHFNLIKALSVIICLMLALSASAYDFEKNGIYYNINGTNVSVTYKTTSYNSYSGTVNIPATVTNGSTTYNVTSIGPSAFQNCTGLTRVVIPNSVYYLMNNAFKGCSGLSNITIPASVGAIYNNVFDGCTFLKTVICLRPNPDQWFTNNFSTTTYTYATLLVPKGSLAAYQSISDDYCWGNFNNIEEVDFDFVQDAIFYDDLDNNKAAVCNVSQSSYECYSGDIVIPQTVTNNGNTYTVTSVASDAFYYGHYLYNLVLPSTINAIGSYAFYDCTNLTSVNIPEGITAINYCTFGNCQSLPSITIPSSVTWIAQNAFVHCNQLMSIACRATTPPMCVDSSCFPSEAYSNATLTVPSAALNDYKAADVWKNFSNIIGKNSDFEAGGIYYIITGPNTASVTYKDRNYNSYSGTVNVPSTVTHDGTTYTVTAVGRAAFYNCPDLTEVTLPNTVTMLDYAAFANCSSLTAIEIPGNVTELGEFCFQSCTALEVLRFNGELTAIPRQCFMYCSSLHTLTWPSTIKEIGPYALYECTNLGSLILPDDLETLQPYALAHCSSLSGVTIPGQVSFIGQGTFSGCTGLYYFGVAQANQHYTAVDRCLMDISCDTLIAYPNLYSQNYTIPNGVKVIGPAAFGSCNNLLSVTIPEGVTSIEDVAFSGCSNLQSVSLSNSITNIGYSAFRGCESLPSFYIPANVATIGVAPFGQCTSMTGIQVDDNNPNFMDDEGVLYSRNGTRLIQYPGGRPDKHYSVLNTTTDIDDMAFEFSSVKSVYLPKSLRNMGYEMFYFSSVERVVIDEGLDTIPEYTFYACENLKSVYLPSTIKSIGRQAFYYCVYLEDITIAVNGNAPAIDNNAFYGLAWFTDNRSANIYVPDGMASKYNGLDEWVDAYGVFNDIVSLGSGVEFTVDSLNYKTTDANLNAMVSDVTSKNLIDPGIPPKVAYQGNLCNVITIGANALKNCTKMRKIEVPFTVQLLDNYCFYGSTNVNTILLHEGLKRINGYAFAHINKVTSIDIPASVDSIRGDAFIVDPLLRYINADPSNTKYATVDGVLFSKDRKMLVSFPDGYGASYTVPSGTQTIGGEAFRGDYLLENVALPTSLLKIDGYAFFGCSALPNVVVPKGVTIVESYAFGSCTAMTEVELPSTLTELGFNAFYNVPNLTSLTVKATTPPECKTYLDPHTGEIYYPFMEKHYTQCTLYVPLGSKTAYQQATIWKNFSNIVEVDFPAEFLRGDVNGDNQVDINDVTDLIDCLLGINTSGINAENADVDFDGELSINDVTALIDHLLGLGWSD